ncbi:hypothetical protein [Nocardia otitidiscaviarum]|nr:hypothetical protein [Nocardia otitidiscaviarum]
MTLDDALIAGKLHVNGQPVVDWQSDPKTGRVELFLAAEWEPGEVADGP